MTRLAIARVEELAASQGYKTLKFFNRKKQEVILPDIDWILEGEGSNELILDGENLNLPTQDVAPGELLNGDDEPLEVDEDVDPTEVADLIQDMQSHHDVPEPDQNPIEDENINEVDGYNSGQENSEGDPEVCDNIIEADPNENVIDPVPELIPEEKKCKS